MSYYAVLFALQAAVRLGGSTRQALRERALARPVALPLPAVTLVDRTNWALNILQNDPRLPRLRRNIYGDAPPLPEDTAEGAEQRDALFETACDRWRADRARLPAEVLETLGDAASVVEPESAVGLVYVAQWRNDVSPGVTARIGLSLFDIALEYAGANPAVFGADARTEPFISALAINLRSLVRPLERAGPGGMDGAGEAFAQRAVAVFFRSGLQALHDHPSAFVDEEHVAELASAMLEPLVTLFARQPTSPSWVRIRETLLGPVTNAAFATLADRQTAFLGDAFADDQALGAMTQRFFQEVADHSLERTFSKGGLTRIYTSMLTTMADNPSLVASGGGLSSAMGRGALSGMAQALLTLPRPYDHAAMRAHMASTALEAVASQSSAAADHEADPWDRAAARGVSAFVAGLAANAAAPGFQRVVDRPFLLAMSRLVFEEAARTPGMLAGDEASAEVASVVSGVSALLAHPASDLMGRAHWREVVDTFVRAATTNPGAVTPLGGDGHGPVVSGLLSLMDVAEANARPSGGGGARRPGAVMFGATLAGALTAATRAAAGHPSAAAHEEAWTAVTGLAMTLNGLASTTDGRIGAAEWVWLFRAWVAEAVAGGLDPDAPAEVVLAPLLAADAPVVQADEAAGEEDAVERGV